MRAKEVSDSRRFYRGPVFWALALTAALLLVPGLALSGPDNKTPDGKAPEDVLLLAGGPDIPDYGYRCVKNRLSVYKDEQKPKIYFAIVKSFGIKITTYTSTDFGLNAKSCYRSEKDGYQINVHVAKAPHDKLCSFENTNRHEDFEVSQFRGMVRCRRY